MQKKRKQKPASTTRIGLCSTFWFSALIGASAHAQTSASVIEEVLVTAQKRSTKLIEVPIAITVLSPEDINNSSAWELSQLGEYLPNVLITQNNDFATIVIRGVGASSRNIGFDTRVGVYLDGVYMGHSPSVNQDLVDLERIEVIRGPQGTLFGKNAIAGAISMISKKPEADFSARASAKVYNYNGLDLKAVVNIPLGEKAAARAYLSDRRQDGFVSNIWEPGHVPTTINIIHPFAGPIFGLPLCDELGGSTPVGCVGGPVGPDEAPDTKQRSSVQSYRVQLSYFPGEKWDVNLAVDGLKSDRSNDRAEPLSDSSGSTIDHFAPERLEVSYSRTGRQERDIFGASANVDYDFDSGFQLKSITAYRDTELLHVSDTDASGIDYAGAEFTDQYEQLSQEFQLVSPDQGMLKYVAGLYYMNQKAETGRFIPIGNAGWVLGVWPGTVIPSEGEVQTKSVALYADGSYDLNDQWRLGMGVRYSKETRDTEYFLDGSVIPPVWGIGSTRPGGYIDSISEDDFSPTVNIAYTTMNGTHWYVKYSSGYKSGGFNVDFVSQADIDNGLDFDPETVDSYELGMKGLFYDDRLSLNAAVFIALYDNYQVNQFFDLGVDPDTGNQLTSVRITNAAKVDTRGMELEATFSITEKWTLNGFLGLLDASFDDFPGGTSTEIPEPGAPGGVIRIPVNAAGNKLPGAPDISAGLSVQYNAKLSAFNASWMFRLDALYTGDYFSGIENEKVRVMTGTHPLTFTFDIDSYGIPNEVQFGYVDSATILNGRLGLIDGDGRWEFYLWGRNLTDEDEYVGYARDFMGSLLAFPRNPRTYGIEIAVHF